ncbi:MAG: aminopeptidase [Bacteroidetes bacterium 43-16]|nr:MAG: aminopeptidase [Bacteroidetes bacterium 43-16]
MKKITLSIIAGMFVFSAAMAQDNLVKATSNTKVDTAKKAYRFTEVINIDRTSVENQGSSGTCWSYATGSFLESEMIKAGRKPIHLSKIFHARKQYEDKSDVYVRMGGNIGWGDGGEAHDVINSYRKYGTVPQEVYSGLTGGATRNNFGEMQAVLEGMLKGVTANKNGSINPVWKSLVTTTLDAYLGKVPENFTYNGKNYTPKSFAKEVVGLNPDDYIEFMSQTNTPYWEKAMMMVPDNWSFEWVNNIPMNEMTNIIDYALKQGYTVTWATDVSEPYFSWPNGVAYVPENALSLDAKRMKKEERDALFTEVKKEMVVTPELRQVGLDNQTTTDDHGMHIVGLSKDQNGKEYYIVKNSWGEDNDYKGYLNVSKAYVQLKTTGILLNKKGVPAAVMSKIQK